MENKKCDEILQLLSFYMDKELSKEEEIVVKDHLKNCSDCSKEYAELLELKRIMEEIKEEEIEAPEGFTQSVMNRIEEENLSLPRTGKVHKFFDAFFSKPWIPAVIAAMLLVVMYIPGSLGPMVFSKVKSAALDDGIMYESEANKMMPGVSRSMEEAASPMEAQTLGGEFTNQEEAGAQRKIIRNGYISSEVTNYRETEKEIIIETEKLGGYVSGSNSYYYGENQDLLAGNINIRIPEDKFDQMLTFLESKGKTVSENMVSSDVTEEFFDISTRIKNLKIKEDRLLAILSKQGDLKDLLAVENEIAQTRSEIENLEGRLNLLNSQIAFSEIEVNLREVRSLNESISKDSVSGFGSKIKESIIRSVNMILDLGVKGIILITSALPFLLILIILYFVFRIIWNKKNRDL